MQIRNKRPYAVEVDHDGVTYTAAAGDTVDVPDELGESLLEQHDAWSSGDDHTSKRPARAASEKED